MSYIIDGHNLIGALPDIDLGQPDDEAQLLARLRGYRARTGGQPMIVFFDSGDLPAQTPDPSSPGVQVRFAAAGQTADDAIVAYLRARSQPGQYAVVTNDTELTWRVREAGASVLRASDFAAKLGTPRRQPKTPAVHDATPNPRDPAFADIYHAFVAAEKDKRRFPGAQQVDVAGWIERLYDGDPQLAERAAQWLGQHSGEAGLEPLRDALTHADPGVRAAAALALGHLGDPGAVPHLCGPLAHDGNSLVREAAAQGLGAIGDRSAIPALEVAATADTKGKVRKAARAALAQIHARRGSAS